MILTIKKKWFDMILSGEKTEEYRAIKPYYTARFRKLWGGSLVGGDAEREITFQNGYKSDAPSFTAVCTIRKGYGKKEWGADRKECYILKIHEIKERDKEMEKSYTDSD